MRGLFYEKNIFDNCLCFIYCRLNAKSIKNNYGILLTENDVINLKNLGFSNEEIMNMPENVVNDNKNILSQLIDNNTIYIKSVYIYEKNNAILDESQGLIFNNNNYNLINIINTEITENEYQDIANDEFFDIVYNSNPQIHVTNAKKLTTSISYISSIKQYRLKNELVWKKTPSYRGNDLFGISGPSATQIPVSGSQNAYGSWDDYDTCRLIHTSKNKQYTNKWYFQSEGYAVFFQIPKDYTEEIVWNTQYDNIPYPCKDGNIVLPVGSTTKMHTMSNMIFTFYYNVAKQNDGSSVNAFGSYQHTVKNLTLGTNFGLSLSPNGGLGGAFNINASFSSYFDNMGGTYAQVLNPEW